MKYQFQNMTIASSIGIYGTGISIRTFVSVNTNSGIKVGAVFVGIITDTLESSTILIETVSVGQVASSGETGVSTFVTVNTFSYAIASVEVLTFTSKAAFCICTIS